MPLTAFQPQGPTKLVAATSSTASLATQVCTGSQQVMRVVNASTGTLNVYVAAGTSSVQAACPTTAVPCEGVCIPAQSYVNLTVPPAGWLSAATSGSSCNVFATAGSYGA